MRIFILIFCFLSFSTNAVAANRWSVGASLIAENSFNKTTSSDSGSPQLVGSLAYPLLLGLHTEAFFDWNISYLLGKSLINRKEAGTSVSEDLLTIGAHFGKEFSGRSLGWYVGTTFIQSTLKGEGGTKALSNGTGTAVFANPGRDSTSRVFSLDTGLEYELPEWLLKSGLQIKGPLSNTKRSIDLYFSFSWFFGGRY